MQAESMFDGGVQCHKVQFCSFAVFDAIFP